MLCLCKETYCCFDRKSNKYKLSSKGLKKELWLPVEMDPCQSIAVIVTSTTSRFRTMKHSVATYEQTKQWLSYFYPKRFVEEDGIHTKALYL